ncbi:hypothetical protein AOT31_10110 [Corynebacterium ulcerans]|uniref:alpha/beta hydrolase n=1 Tax=Corynebacterium ulcerans TaxID=65058 RepID=UPI0006C81D75|nr:alpha/beta hydrolase [Corynebacterium ulcerans]KPJ23333.1 hypothetical protein AOT31_10110 [Corynebacterium ulcerans]
MMFTLQSGQLLASAHALSAFSRSGSSIAQGLRSTWNQGLEQLYGRAFEIAAATLTRRLSCWLDPHRAANYLAHILSITARLQEELEHHHEYLRLLPQRTIDESFLITKGITHLQELGKLLDATCAQSITQLAALCTDETDYPPSTLTTTQLQTDFPDAEILHADAHHAVVAFGNVSTASSITTLVAGVSSSDPNTWPDNFRHAQRVSQATGGAAIAWLGYSAPAHIPAAVATAPASRGAQALKDFQASLRSRNPQAKLLVLGHSYGSVIAGKAAETGLEADTLIFAGSPGVPPVIKLNTDSPRIISALGSLDPIGLTGTKYTAVHGKDPTALGFPTEQWGIPGGHSSYITSPLFLKRLAEEAQR